MSTAQVVEHGTAILLDWIRTSGHTAELVRSSRLAIDGDVVRLAIISTALHGKGFRVQRPEQDTAIHIQVCVGEGDGGSWPVTEIVVLDVDYAWQLPGICGRSVHQGCTEHNFATRTPELDRLLRPFVTRTPLELGDRLADLL